MSTLSDVLQFVGLLGGDPAEMQAAKDRRESEMQLAKSLSSPKYFAETMRQGLLSPEVPMPPRRPPPLPPRRAEGLLEQTPAQGLLYPNPPMPPDRLTDKTFSNLIEYGVDPVELRNIITGESRLSTRARNPDTDASGLFQFTRDAAKELGTNVDDILKMSPKEQSDLYLKYLKRWGWKPGVPLGLMQAAPSLARTWDKRSKDDVVYKKGSKAWIANPGWRPENEGDITVRSIENYYASQK